jgi:hypothetical protein
MKDTRTWQQAEDVADSLMDHADSSAHAIAHAQQLQNKAIFYMLRAILLRLGEKSKKEI